MAVEDAVGDGAPPVVAGLDFVLVEPDIVAAMFQIGVDATDKFLVGVVAVAEEDA
jgi:hypothetical protein